MIRGSMFYLYPGLCSSKNILTEGPMIWHFKIIVVNFSLCALCLEFMYKSIVGARRLFWLNDVMTNRAYIVRKFYFKTVKYITGLEKIKIHT